jgi:hypothetical protein
MPIPTMTKAPPACRRSSATTYRDFAGPLPVDGRSSGVSARMYTRAGGPHPVKLDE